MLSTGRGVVKYRWPDVSLLEVLCQRIDSDDVDRGGVAETFSLRDVLPTEVHRVLLRSMEEATRIARDVFHGSPSRE